MFIALFFQLWLLGSLAWLFYSTRRARARGVTGWRAALVAAGPLMLLLAVCVVGAARMVLH
jgi:hypothetical protein